MLPRQSALKLPAWRISIEKRLKHEKDARVSRIHSSRHPPVLPLRIGERLIFAPFYPQAPFQDPKSIACVFPDTSISVNRL